MLFSCLPIALSFLDTIDPRPGNFRCHESWSLSVGINFLLFFSPHTVQSPFLSFKSCQSRENFVVAFFVVSTNGLKLNICCLQKNNSNIFWKYFFDHLKRKVDSRWRQTCKFYPLLFWEAVDFNRSLCSSLFTPSSSNDHPLLLVLCEATAWVRIPAISHPRQSAPVCKIGLDYEKSVALVPLSSCYHQVSSGQRDSRRKAWGMQPLVDHHLLLLWWVLKPYALHTLQRTLEVTSTSNDVK